MTIFGLVIFFVRPIREKILKTKERDERIQARAEGTKNLILGIALDKMTDIYYEAMRDGELNKYKYDSFFNIYSEYEKLGGNHWGKKMAKDMEEIRTLSE
jgi:hypothetical protein